MADLLWFWQRRHKVWQVGDCKRPMNGSETCDPFRQVLGFESVGNLQNDDASVV